MDELTKLLKDKVFNVVKKEGRDQSMVDRGWVLRGRAELHRFESGEAEGEHALYVFNIDNWVRTSPIKAWVDKVDRIEVQTLNSIYELIKV